MSQSVCNASKLMMAPLQSSFTDVCRVFTSLLQFSRKSKNSRTKRLEQKPNETLRLGTLLSDILKKEGRGKKSFKEGNYAVRIIDDKNFYQERKCLEA